MARGTIEERFREFHAAHPEVYELFKRFADEIRSVGKRTYGARSIVERIRWHCDTTSQGAESFKINDNYISRYARKLIEDDPSFKSFFVLRQLQTP